MCAEFSSEPVLTQCFASSDVMKQFDHPHIIRLIGLCMDPPIYIIMELAPHGEVRLNSNAYNMSDRSLSLYTHTSALHENLRALIQTTSVSHV